MRKNTGRKAIGYIALALVCVLAGTAIGTQLPAATAETVVLTSPFTEAIAKVRDSVVGVNNYQLVSGYGNGYGYGYGYGFGNPWDYYGYPGYGYGQSPDSGREIKYGSGSGVVVAKEYVLTNYHVIEGASSVKVSVGDNDEDQYDATVAAYDEAKDVAVLYVPGLQAEPVALGDSDALQVGDWVVNIGNPVGFTRTATAGIVSALNREIETDVTTTDRFGRRQSVSNTMIQTDAAINSGNSGGGMFNTAGELVGIPTLKYSGSRYNGASVESIGMCIPINEAKPVIEEALKGQRTAEGTASGTAQQPEKTDGTQQPEARNDRTGKPRLGVLIGTMRSDAYYGAVPNGAFIISVDENGPADQAGLKAGDILVELNGEVVSSGDDLVGMLEGSRAGDTVTVTVWRPAKVYDAQRGHIEPEGEYIENIQVTLEILEEASST